jgi:hypothetical protein
MGDPKWFSWAYIIDSTKQVPPWWKRVNLALIVAVASLLISLLSAGANWWYTWLTRQILITEHRPVLEITEALKGESSRRGGSLRVKNSGRSTAFLVRNDEVSCDVGTIMGDNAGPVFENKWSNSSGPSDAADIPTGGTTDVDVRISCGNSYTVGSALRVRGILHYQDETQNRYELPWCYVSDNPENERWTFYSCRFFHE